MAWILPRSWNPGETMTAALLNAHLRDNLNVLKTKVDDSGLLRTLYYGDEAWKSNVAPNFSNFNSFTLGANDLNSGGQGLRILTLGSLANNTNAKSIRFVIAGVVVVTDLVVSSAAIAGNVFTLDLAFWWVNSTNVRCWARSTYNAASGATPANNRQFTTAIPGLDFTADQEVKFQGEGVADNDITTHGIQVQSVR